MEVIFSREDASFCLEVSRVAEVSWQLDYNYRGVLL